MRAFRYENAGMSTLHKQDERHLIVGQLVLMLRGGVLYLGRLPDAAGRDRTAKQLATDAKKRGVARGVARASAR